VALLVTGTSVCSATFSEAFCLQTRRLKPVVTLVASTVCDVTNTLVENDPNFCAVNIEAMYLSETIIPIHTALLTYHNVY
jgi:hypothetical protein